MYSVLSFSLIILCDGSDGGEDGGAGQKRRPLPMTAVDLFLNLENISYCKV